MERVLCFEYMHGGSLDKHIEDEACGLEWPTCYKIIKGTCEGINYLHNSQERHIYHLNLKPGNILLDKSMTPKIADLGLSRLVDSIETDEPDMRQGTLWNIHMYGFMLPRITNTMHPALSFVATNHSLSFVPTTCIGVSLILYCLLQAPMDHHMFELFVFQRLFLWISIFIDQKARVQVSTITVLSGRNHPLLCPHFSKILQRYI